MSTRKVVLGAMAGLATGAIAGILFAPEKGSVSRQQIIDKGDDYAGNLKSKFNDFSDSVTGKLSNAKNEAERLADKGKDSFEDAKKDVRNVASNFKQDHLTGKHI